MMSSKVSIFEVNAVCPLGISKNLSLADYLGMLILTGDVLKFFNIEDVYVHCNRLALLSDTPVCNGYRKQGLKELLDRCGILESRFILTDNIREVDLVGARKSNIYYRLREDKLGFEYDYTIESNNKLRDFLLDYFDIREECKKMPFALMRNLFLYNRLV